MYLPFFASETTVQSFINLYIPRLQALSNAAIVSWTATWSARDDQPEIAALGSDVGSNLVLIYRQDDTHDWIWVPSPRSNLFEQEGTYKGIRLDALRPDVIDILEGWQDVVAVIVNNNADSFPVEFVVAGLSL